MSGNTELDTLLVRHLPDVLSKSEKAELLKHFGAVDVHCMCDRGPMKHCAIARFEDNDTASKALQRLHQLKVIDQRLVVEYAIKIPKHLKSTSSTDATNILDLEEEKKKVKKECVVSLSDFVKERSQHFTGIAPLLGVNYSSSPYLKYHYPPPSRETLTNILHALSSVPKFYVQVLHLMNKMNLPAPFGPVTAEPPLATIDKGYQGYDEIYQTEMQISSSEEESELESDEEERQERRKDKVTAKRSLPKKKAQPRKKPKLQQLLPAVKPTAGSTTYTTSEVFDTSEQQQQQQQPKKMEFKLTETISGIQPTSTERRTANLQKAEVRESSSKKVETGFGKIIPVSVDEESDEEEEETENDEEEESTEFISDKELRQNRMSSQERSKLSAFKRYDAGEPNTRLYVKNVSKQADVKDLKFIFGRYVDFTSELEKDMFDVRLMKEGRMKGQAFIGLPSEEKAISAVQETNGYLLHGKPIVVQFARSAKPKEKEKEGKKKS